MVLVLSFVSLYFAFIIIITIIDNKVWFLIVLLLVLVQEIVGIGTEKWRNVVMLDAICTGLYL